MGFGKKIWEKVKNVGKRLLSVMELAQKLGVCRNTAYTLAARPDFYPAIRIGRRICVDPDQLEKWIDERGREKNHAVCRN